MPANIVDKYQGPERSTQVKQGIAQDVSGPKAKCLWVESPNPSKGNCEDGDTLEPQVISQPPPEKAVAWYPTEVIMDVELLETGDAKGFPCSRWQPSSLKRLKRS